MRCDAPPVISLGLFGFQANLIVRNAGLFRAFLTIKLAVSARVYRVIPGDVEYLSGSNCLFKIFGHLIPAFEPTLDSI